MPKMFGYYFMEDTDDPLGSGKLDFSQDHVLYMRQEGKVSRHYYLEGEDHRVVRAFFILKGLL